MASFESKKMNEGSVSADEKKRRRLEAWRRKQQQQQPPPTVSAAPVSPPKLIPIALSLGKIPVKRKPKAAVKAPNVIVNAFGGSGGESDPPSDDDDDDATGPSSQKQLSRKRNRPLDMLSLTDDAPLAASAASPTTSSETTIRSKKKKRWDAKANGAESSNKMNSESTHKGEDEDALDRFMDQLQSSELKHIVTKELSIEVSGTMIQKVAKGGGTPSSHPSPLFQPSGGIITAEQLSIYDKPQYTPSDWMSDGGVSDEEEEQARRAMIEALKAEPVVPLVSANERDDDDPTRPAQLAAEVKTEKSRREEEMRRLERQAEEARQLAEQAAAPEVGRLFNDVESGVMEEAERYLSAAQAAPDALQVLAELNKKKELSAVDHSTIDYLPFTKNLYRVPRGLAKLSNEEVISRRAKLKVRVRGHGAPAPVSSFEECGLSEKILKVLSLQNIDKPFPVQAQCIPCIMGKFEFDVSPPFVIQRSLNTTFLSPFLLTAGRDVIGIAKSKCDVALIDLAICAKFVSTCRLLSNSWKRKDTGLSLATSASHSGSTTVREKRIGSDWLDTCTGTRTGLPDSLRLQNLCEAARAQVSYCINLLTDDDATSLVLIPLSVAADKPSFTLSLVV